MFLVYVYLCQHNCSQLERLKVGHSSCRTLNNRKDIHKNILILNIFAIERNNARVNSNERCVCRNYHKTF